MKREEISLNTVLEEWSEKENEKKDLVEEFDTLVYRGATFLSEKSDSF